MVEVITSIEEVRTKVGWGFDAGYKVTTTEQEITLLIDDESS